MDLSRIIERHAEFTPRQVALHCEGQDIDYALLWQRIRVATRTLRHMGIAAGDRVAWLGQNDPVMLVLLFAAARIGAILLPLNYRLAAAEHGMILADAGAAMLVCDAGHMAAGEPLAAAVGVRPVAAEQIDGNAPAGHAPVGSGPLRGDDGSAVLLVYTSGTAGKPKGVLHSQSGLLWNCINATHAQQLHSDDHVLSVLPLFHVGGLCIQTLPALHAGATVTLQRRFDAGRWLFDVQTRRPHLSVMVPATLRAVQQHPDFAGADLSSLRLIMAGSSVVPVSLIDAFHRRGVPVGQVYGATETGPVSIYLRREDAMRCSGAAGRAGLHVAVRLVDSTGADVGPGEIGEIWIRGPSLMQRYWGKAQPSFDGGWFRSGDLARQDAQGCYWVVGRSRDMIISGGENIYPAEIENLLADCPGIAEAAVVGQPDPHWGEVAVAIVVRAPGARLDAAAVLALLENHIARFKLPRRILFHDALPRTALGKVQKPELLHWLAQQPDQ